MISRIVATVFALSLGGGAMAHPVPDTLMVLSSMQGEVSAQVTLPLSEFALVYDQNATEDKIAAILAAHTSVASVDGGAWTVSVDDVTHASAMSDDGEYPVITAEMTFVPPSGQIEPFTLMHDPIITKVITDSVIVSFAEAPGEVVGVIYVDPATGGIEPVVVTP